MKGNLKKKLIYLTVIGEEMPKFGVNIIFLFRLLSFSVTNGFSEKRLDFFVTIIKFIYAV